MSRVSYEWKDEATREGLSSFTFGLIALAVFGATFALVLLL